MTKNIINTITVPAGCEVDLPKRIASLAGRPLPNATTSLSNKLSTVEPRVHSIRKKSDNLFRKGRRQTSPNAQYTTSNDPNTNEYEGPTANLTMSKNPLQHSMAVAAEDAKKREAATAGFKETSKGSAEIGGNSTNNFKSKAVHRINQHLERIRDEFGDRRRAA